MTGIRWSREIVPQKSRGAIWIMVGRPRKQGRRQPNGQLARAYVNPRAQVAAQPHRAVMPVRLREKPEAESNFGQLCLRDKITRAQYEAGKMYCALTASMHATYDIPSPHPRAIDLERIAGIGAREIPPHAAERIRQAYMRAFECLSSHRIQRAMSHHVVRDVPISDFDTLDLLKIGLSRLVEHFSLAPDMQISESRI